MYAIIKTGGKQYRVAEGEHLLVERLPDAEGATVDLTPLLIVDGDTVSDGDALGKLGVSARIVGPGRGPKVRILKVQPKRGYKRRNGHRQELTRIEITSIGSGSASGSRSRSKPKAKATEEV